jgi:hypothetical protein
MSEFKRLTEEEIETKHGDISGQVRVEFALKAAYAEIDRLNESIVKCCRNQYSYIHCEEHKRLEAEIAILKSKECCNCGGLDD